MISLRCGCRLTNAGVDAKQIEVCERHQKEHYLPSDWKGFYQERGPQTERRDWMEVYDNYG